VSYDLLIRGGTLVTCDGEQRADLAVTSGKIVAIGRDLDGEGASELDARGRYVLPGYIDAHVHLNEPGREVWEGFATGTAALAAGGCTTFIDMPLNSTPVIDAASFEAKAAALRKNSRLDGALWGGLVPGHLETMKEMAACGAIGFKAFMSNSGMADFPRSNRDILREGMQRASALRLPVAVHAESDEMTARLANESQERGAVGVRDYLASRPIAAELDAIGEALELSRATGCALHVVHVSSAAGLKLIDGARSAGQEVTAETCPHYLLMDEEDVIRVGAVAKCAPPLRPAEEKELLWKALAAGQVQTIGSDHSPSPPGMKLGDNFFKIWGGIAGAQHNYPLFAEEALKRGIPLSLIARMTALNVAQRFCLPNKGNLRVGWDADLVVIDPNAEPHTITADDLLTRHKISAYVGRTTRTRVVATVTGGHIVHGPGAKPLRGRLLRPLSPL
jgi:allantoinase